MVMGGRTLLITGSRRNWWCNIIWATNGWSAPKHWAIDDGQLTANALVSGDFGIRGSSHRSGVAGGKRRFTCCGKKADHTRTGEPERIPYSGSVKAIQVLDIEGDVDGTIPLLVNWESPTPFRFRLQNDAGQLGPEVYFTLPPIRSYWADNLETNKNTQP